MFPIIIAGGIVLLVLVIIISICIGISIGKSKQKNNVNNINNSIQTEKISDGPIVCKNCGTTLDANQKFCINCGAKIEIKPKEEISHQSQKKLKKIHQ